MYNEISNVLVAHFGLKKKLWFFCYWDDYLLCLRNTNASSLKSYQLTFLSSHHPELLGVEGRGGGGHQSSSWWRGPNMSSPPSRTLLRDRKSSRRSCSVQVSCPTRLHFILLKIILKNTLTWPSVHAGVWSSTSGLRGILGVWGTFTTLEDSTTNWKLKLFKLCTQMCLLVTGAQKACCIKNDKKPYKS